MLSDTERAELLAEVLRQGPGYGKTVSMMILVDALDELFAWLDDPRPFDGYRKRAWLSIESELRASLKSCGPQLRALMEPRLKGFNMGDVTNRAKRSEDLEPDRRLVKLAAEHLPSDLGMLATWQDVVTCTKRGDVSLVRSRLREFYGIVERRGIEADNRGMTTEGVMFDRLLDVENARHVLGDETRPDDRGIRDVADESAGLTFDERAELVGRLLCMGDQPADYVVWLGIERASLTGMALDVGSIRFFDARLIAEVLAKPIGERGDRMPPEILDDRWSKNWLPQGEFVVLARIDMGTRPGSFVARDARRRLVTLLAPSDRFYSNDWKVLPCHIVYRGGNSVSHSVFENIEEAPTHLRLEGVADAWLREDAAAVERVLSTSSSPETERFLDLYEWDVAHRTDDSLTTVLLAVRTIETISMSFLAGVDWEELVGSYVSHFAWSRLRSELADVASHVLNSFDRNPIDANRERLREIFFDATSQSRSATSTDLARFVDHLPEIRRLWTNGARHQMDEVIVERLVRASELDSCLLIWTDADEFSVEYERAVGGIEREVDRLIRIRNAAQHGGPIPRPSVDGAVSLANHARGQILVDVLDALLEGKSPGNVLAALERLDSERRRVLTQSGLPIKALAVMASE